MPSDTVRQMRHVLGHDSEPVGQARDLDGHEDLLARVRSVTNSATAASELGRRVTRSSRRRCSASSRGLGRSDAGGARDGVGKFGRMGGGERDHRHGRIAR